MILDEFLDDRPRMTIVHFNRIEMQRGGDHVWTVHNSRGCFNVKSVEFYNHMKSIYRKDGPQPRAKFKGIGRLEIRNGEATLL